MPFLFVREASLSNFIINWLCSLKTCKKSSNILKWKVGVNIFRRVNHLLPSIKQFYRSILKLIIIIFSIITCTSQQPRTQPLMEETIFTAFVNQLVTAQYYLIYKRNDDKITPLYSKNNEKVTNEITGINICMQID